MLPSAKKASHHFLSRFLINDLFMVGSREMLKPVRPQIFHQFSPPNSSFDIVNSAKDPEFIVEFIGCCATGGWLVIISMGRSKWRSCEIDFVLTALKSSGLMDWVLF